MRFVIALLLGFFLCFSSLVGLAKSNQVKTVPLYATQSASAKVLAQVSPWQRIVPIYRQKNWLKIGLPENGNVGWLNIKQYQKLIDDNSQSAFRTVFVKIKGKSLKPGQYKIVAYKNGKKLDQKEAEKLVQHIQARQIRVERRMQHLQQQMNRLFQQSANTHGLDVFSFDDGLPGFSTFPMVEPIVVVVQPGVNGNARYRVDHGLVKYLKAKIKNPVTKARNINFKK